MRQPRPGNTNVPNDVGSQAWQTYRTAHARTTYAWGVVKTHLHIDAKSVFSALSATFVKTPADCSSLTHLHYAQAQPKRKVLTSILWMGARDTIADGLTRGSGDRILLSRCMDGYMNIQHDCEQYVGKAPGDVTIRQQQTDDGDDDDSGQRQDHVEEQGATYSDSSIAHRKSY